jgi:hypothetical protein
LRLIAARLLLSGLPRLTLLRRLSGLCRLRRWCLLLGRRRFLCWRRRGFLLWRLLGKRGRDQE